MSNKSIRLDHGLVFFLLACLIDLFESLRIIWSRPLVLFIFHEKLMHHFLELKFILRCASRLRLFFYKLRRFLNRRFVNKRVSSNYLDHRSLYTRYNLVMSLYQGGDDYLLVPASLLDSINPLIPMMNYAPVIIRSPQNKI